MDVPKLLTALFELQRFEAEPALQNVIDETGERCFVTELSDDALSGLSAAGDPYTALTDPRKRKGTP